VLLGDDLLEKPLPARQPPEMIAVRSSSAITSTMVSGVDRAVARCRHGKQPTSPRLRTRPRWYPGRKVTRHGLMLTRSEILSGLRYDEVIDCVERAHRRSPMGRRRSRRARPFDLPGQRPR